MENLPAAVITTILSRLTDSSDLTQCRLTSKLLNSLTYDVTSLRFLCTYARYKNKNPSSTPFKTLVTRYITQSTRLDSLSLGVDCSLRGLTFDELDDEESNLYLTDDVFVMDWLCCVQHRLKSLSVVDFWVQSCWRQSHLLSLLSRHCHRLNSLEVKNAWLSMEGLTTMASLTSLTLEYVRLDDENLSNLNDCFPRLQTLKLIGIGLLLNPKISLQHLKRCQWTISNSPHSLTIVAPKMVELELSCVRPRSLLLETPLLSVFHLILETTGLFDIRELPHLKKLQIESLHLSHLIHSFPCSSAVKELRLDSVKKSKMFEVENPSFELLFDIFPNICSLNLGPNAYSEMEASLSVGLTIKRKGLKCLKDLKDLKAYLVINDIEVTLSFISSILHKCDNLSTISLLVDRDVDPVQASYLMFRCHALCSGVQLKWGFWKEGSKDVWLSDIV